MPVASEVRRVRDDLFVWSAFSEEVGFQMTSSAFAQQGAFVLIDPIKMTEDAWRQLCAWAGEPRAILWSSCNHVRDSAHYRDAYKLPTACSPGAHRSADLRSTTIFTPNEVLYGLAPLDIPGGAEGETAFLSKTGVLILGDAVINVDGLSLLPDKYCEDGQQNVASLRGLLDYDFDCVTFAHGDPLTENAKARLKALLDGATK